GVERDIRMSPGDTAQVAGLEWTFVGMREREGKNFVADQGRFDIRRDGQRVTTVFPEKRHYPVQGSVMTDAGISPGLFRDLFVALGEPVDGDQAWAVRIQYKPLIRWIWLGAIFMAAGGILAVSDKRYRVRQSVVKRASGKGPESAGAGTLQEVNG
ncbi:MAG: cytochrome c-type biogenesis CcmF C-terminal domain-containing protein, partial [Oleiphilaceae bacterium]|nr:cytochrome c-type biogenesis CcmF C-terminal domain-containing protein [Oleiphilaceae bacterium]